MGETFLDGFLEKDAVRLEGYYGALRDIGCEELTDLLLVEIRDLQEMGMSSPEIERFKHGVAEIRRWKDHQDDLGTISEISWPCHALHICQACQLHVCSFAIDHSV